MEQKDAQNLITLEKFLESLEIIISGFKTYVDTTNKRINALKDTVESLKIEISKANNISKESKNAVQKLVEDFNRAESQFEKLNVTVSGGFKETKSIFLKANKENKPKKEKKTSAPK